MEDYLSDVYTDVIEGYLIASIKVQIKDFGAGFVIVGFPYPLKMRKGSCLDKY